MEAEEEEVTGETQKQRWRWTWRKRGLAAEGVKTDRRMKTTCGYKDGSAVEPAPATLHMPAATSPATVTATVIATATATA
jgi:hypothetical protein